MSIYPNTPHFGGRASALYGARVVWPQLRLHRVAFVELWGLGFWFRHAFGFGLVSGLLGLVRARRPVV